MIPLRTQVAIVGAGPAGLMLGHLLHLGGIDSVILENRSRDYVIERVRAGVLEQGTVDLMTAAGVGDRLRREGMRHGGIYIAFNGRRHHIDMEGLTGGRAITIYGQNEVVKDLIEARTSTSGRCSSRSRTSPVGLRRVTAVCRSARTASSTRSVRFHRRLRWLPWRLPDGRSADHLQVYEREYPFGWLGILAHAAPSSDELVYSNHPRGFALFSMRSPQVTRLYLQCAPGRGRGTSGPTIASGRSCRRDCDRRRMAAERRGDRSRRA